MKKKLSLCMIVKDEEQFIGQCLASVKPIIDEIVIVDTGSVDRTIEIAKEFGAKIIHTEWHNDYEKTRLNLVCPSQ